MFTRHCNFGLVLRCSIQTDGFFNRSDLTSRAVKTVENHTISLGKGIYSISVNLKNFFSYLGPVYMEMGDPR